MLIGGIVVVVVTVVVTVALLTRRVSHDDAHSVEGYHRSLHTLESINAHPAAPRGVAESGRGATPAYPESAVRLAGTPSVRVTDPRPSAVPPVPPPPVADPDVPVTIDDADHSSVPPPPRETGHRDKAMGSINHRPRRLAAPAMAVAAVIVLVVVLLVTGSHTVAPTRHHVTGSTSRHARSPASKPHRNTTTRTTPTTPTTPTTQLPAVSLPQSSTTRGATYEVSHSDFTLALSATSGACWVDATSTTSGTTFFAGTLEPGQGHSFDAAGPVTVVIGAPTVFAASVNGNAVVLPSGFQTPFTMNFVTTVPPTG